MKIITHQVEGAWVRFSGTPQLEPRKIGHLIEEGVWGDDDLALHGLRAAEPFAVPEGKVVTGAEYFSEDGRQQLFAVEDEPEPEPEVLIEQFRATIQAHIDAAAQSRRYENGNSLATYVNSTNAQWSAEAAAFVAWRDAVWAYAYAELDKVLGGLREAPTVEGFIAELPVMEWPE